jgi:hypothetical protein
MGHADVHRVLASVDIIGSVRNNRALARLGKSCTLAFGARPFFYQFRPLFLKSPIFSFFFASTEVTDSLRFRNRFAVRLM